MQSAKNSSLGISLLACATIAAPPIAAFCVAYVHAENPAYPWDYGAYWHYSKYCGHLIVSGTDRRPTDILGQIRSNDYDPAAVVPLAAVACDCPPRRERAGQPAAPAGGLISITVDKRSQPTTSQPPLICREEMEIR